MSTGQILKQLFYENALKTGIFKTPIPLKKSVIEKNVPGLYHNLVNIYPEYISGINDCDFDFLERTTSPYLYKKLVKEYENNGIKSNNDPQGQGNLPKHNFPELPFKIDQIEKIAKNFLVCPYVVFGKTLQERITMHPRHDIYTLTRNRYFAKKHDQGFRDYFKLLQSVQVYGFRCYMVPNIEQKRLYSLTFEGKIDTQEFYTVDIQNVLFNQDPNQFESQQN